MRDKKYHIILIIIGSIFILLGAFHTNLWFDETYSVALMNQNFIDIWKIGATDVHPILYYWLLKIVGLIFNNSILAFRLFSCLGVIVLGILGITHIRKDFGSKTGIIWTFLSFFLPIMSIYASEIRMYSWCCVFVSLTLIYAFRIIKNGSIKNYIIFGIFSLFSAYTHYYGLMTVGLINLFLFIYLLKKKENISKFVGQAIIEVGLYIPWLIVFIRQLTAVSNGFWISFQFPKTILDTLKFQFAGNLSYEIILLLVIILFVYVIRLMIKNKKSFEGIVSIGLYLSIFLIVVLISIFAPMLVPRYMFVLTGALMLFLSIYLAKEKRKWVLILICLTIAFFSIVNNVFFIKENYDLSNETQIDYIKDNIKEDDIIVYTDAIYGAIFATTINHEQYFYNIDDWPVKDAYRAYNKTMKIVDNLDFLNDYSGRIWVIDSVANRLYNILASNYKMIDFKTFETKYHNMSYNIHLLEA